MFRLTKVLEAQVTTAHELQYKTDPYIFSWFNQKQKLT